MHHPSWLLSDLERWPDPEARLRGIAREARLLCQRLLPRRVRRHIGLFPPKPSAAEALQAAWGLEADSEEGTLASRGADQYLAEAERLGADTSRLAPALGRLARRSFLALVDIGERREGLVPPPLAPSKPPDGPCAASVV